MNSPSSPRAKGSTCLTQKMTRFCSPTLASSSGPVLLPLAQTADPRQAFWAKVRGGCLLEPPKEEIPQQAQAC